MRLERFVAPRRWRPHSSSGGRDDLLALRPRLLGCALPASVGDCTDEGVELVMPSRPKTLRRAGIGSEGGGSGTEGAGSGRGRGRLASDLRRLSDEKNEGMASWGKAGRARGKEGAPRRRVLGEARREVRACRPWCSARAGWSAGSLAWCEGLALVEAGKRSTRGVCSGRGAPSAVEGREVSLGGDRESGRGDAQANCCCVDVLEVAECRREARRGCRELCGR